MLMKSLGCMIAAIVGLGFTASARGAAKAKIDADLLMYYTFDRNEGQQIKDRSSYENIAENTNGQWFSDVQGRKGVMRFNGKDAMLTAQHESLAIQGDSTLVMWIRRNADELHPQCWIFSDPGSPQSLDWGFFNHIHFMIYQYWQDAQVGSERLSFPMDHDMFSKDWNHIAVVFEYPRARVYWNGKLHHDFWMVHPIAMSSTKKMIGGNGTNFGFFDLDEFRLYKRALTAAEVSAVFSGKPLPVVKETEILIEPYWYENRLTVRLSSRNEYPADGSMTVRLKTKDGQVKTATAPLKASDSAGTSRTVGEASFELAELIAAPGQLEIDIHNAKNARLRTLTKEVLIEKPAWVYNQAGVAQGVPVPWTPVKAEESDSGLNIDVWGRRYTVGSTPFFAQVNSLDADFLAAPMRIIAVADGKPVEFVHQATELIETKPEAAMFQQRFTSTAGLNLNINCRLEYDGFARFTLDIQTNNTVQIDQLFFEMPVKNEHAIYAHGTEVYPLDRNPGNYVKNSHRGFTGKQDLAWQFTCNTYLGDDYRFLAWQAESDQDWSYKEKTRALEVLPREDATTFRARIIDMPTSLDPDKPRKVEFAILATPTKPGNTTPWELATARSEPYGRDLDWADRKLPDGTPMLENIKRLGLKRLLMTGSLEIWPYPMPVSQSFADKLKYNIDAIHAYGIKVINYVLHQRFPVNVPEFEFNAAHMANRPFITYSAGGEPSGTRRPGPLVKDYGVPSQDTFFVCPKSLALQDAYVYSMKERLEHFGEDGVYLDGTSAHVPPCKNLLHGCGYIDATGALRETFPIFAVRDYSRRIFLATKSVNPDNKVDVHCSFGYNPSALTYVDSIWTGEHWYHLRGKGTDYVAGELPLDMFRSEFTGRQLNLPVDMLTHRLGPLMKISATSLLHDVPCRSSVNGDERLLEVFDSRPTDIEILSRLWRLRDQFGAQDAKLRLYYENGEWVTFGPSGCYVTLLVHPSNGVLAFVTNLTRKQQTVRVKFNLETLNLAGRSLQVLDTMYGKPVSLDVDQTVTITLDSEQWTYVWLKPGE